MQEKQKSSTLAKAPSTWEDCMTRTAAARHLGRPAPRHLPLHAPLRYLHSIGRSNPIAAHIIVAPSPNLCNSTQINHQFNTKSTFHLASRACIPAVMAMATGVTELASAAAFASAVVKTPSLKLQAAPSGVACRRSSAVVAVNASQRQTVEEETTGKRSALMSTVMALAGAAVVMAGSAEAAMQKVEGTEREEQDAVTTGIREPSRLSAAKSNSVQEDAKVNSQASGGLILGAPRLDEPAGAYRSPQSSTYGVDQTGGKRSTPAGILQGSSEGKSGTGGSEPAVIGGDAMESK